MGICTDSYFFIVCDWGTCSLISWYMCFSQLINNKCVKIKHFFYVFLKDILILNKTLVIMVDFLLGILEIKIKQIVIWTLLWRKELEFLIAHPSNDCTNYMNNFLKEMDLTSAHIGHIPSIFKKNQYWPSPTYGCRSIHLLIL